MGIVHLQDSAEKEPMPGFRGRFAHGDTMSLAFWNISAGASLPLHRHPHEQMTAVLDGTFEITIAGNTQTVTAGSVAVIPAHAEHSGRALTDCRIVDAFHPVREDYR